MKRTFRIFTRSASKGRFGVLLLVCFLAAGQLSNGAPLRSARVSAVIHDVRLLPSNAAPRPAAVNENVGLGTAVRTGTESRAELTFADLTVTRLGENTIFSFNEAAREVNVTKGAILLEVPSKAPAAKITTAGVTAGVMGATALFATGPPTKFMMLEGIGTFYPTGHPERTVTVHAGEMVTMTADGRITQPTKFNVQLVLQTSHLIVDFPALANLPLILQVINQQLAEQSAGTANPLPSKNSVVDVIDVISQNVTANPAVLATPVAPGPPVITSSVPYVINNGTVIVTHPTITTNGVTDVGVLYRGRALDGPVSAFAFGSTSAFDIASGFDIQIAGNNAAAGFKFSSLQLAGNPTINTTNGPINLALIAIHGITSGAPGGTITFAGLKGVLLAAQKGSINLGPEISFSGFHDLNIYARGSSSDLTLGSDISTTNEVRLFAERDMSLTSTITTGDLYAFVGRNITINGGSLTIANNNGNIGTGGNISVTAGGNLDTSADTAFTIQNSAGTIDNGGNVSVTISGSVSAHALGLFIDNYDFSKNRAGQIGTGGDMSVAIGGNLTATSVDAFINNRSGGMIGSGGSMIFNIGGALTTQGNAGFIISSRYDASVNGSTLSSMIGSSVTLQINAASIDIGGNMESNSFGIVGSLISDRGGTINGSVTYRWNISGDFTVQGDGDMEILNDGGANILTPFAGTIHGSATLQVGARNFTANSLFTQINNRNGGVIDSAATISFNLNGSFAIPGTNPGDPSANAPPGEADFLIRNQQNRFGTSGGFIGSDAVINLTAANISTGGGFFDSIENFSSGRIGSGATINFGLTGALTSQSFATFSIQNQNGGTIAADAAITLNAANTSSVGVFFAGINNSSTGSIGSHATINFGLTGALMAQSGATFSIQNQNGGTIVADAGINLSAANISSGGVFFAGIQNTSGGRIGSGSSGGGATINLGLTGALISQSDATFSIDNSNAGSIGSDATVTVNAGSISTAGNFFEAINNTGGTIGGIATINMNISGSANVTNNATFQILGSAGVAKGAAINFNGGNYGVGGTFFGTIDGDGAITFSNASVRADIVKVGVFGNNGTLTIGGGAISANTLLKLYAPGSNGMIDFVANCSLSNQAAAVLIAANKVIISNGVVVTIGGGTSPASVFTNIANYTGSGGNGSTTGTFAGNGATTSPLSSAPPFGAAPSSSVNVAQQPAQGGVQGERTIGKDGMLASNRNNRPVHPPLAAGRMPVTNRIQGPSAKGGNPSVGSGRGSGAMINVANSGQLLDLLDNAAPAPGGKIAIPASNRTTHSRNSSRINADSRLKADGRADNPRLLASARSFAP